MNSYQNRPQWPKTAVRVAFGVIWLVDAILKWMPGFRSNYMSYLMGAAKGQPSWIGWWFNFWIRLQMPRTTFFAYLVAVVETLIALALIFGFGRKLTYIAAAVFSFLIWSTAEGFGGPYTTGSTDVGTSIIYVVVFLSLLAFNYQLGPSRFCVDYILEKRISWWYKIAEVGKPTKKQ
ncbi:MAG: DoxX family protein [Actinobacteria bacterium]|nr:DoxX family protein [Actinomycetota bacterium]MCL6105214.1 DoxX family protein [Actinomycetota bacterium]